MRLTLPRDLDLRGPDSQVETNLGERTSPTADWEGPEETQGNALPVTAYKKGRYVLFIDSGTSAGGRSPGEEPRWQMMVRVFTPRPAICADFWFI